MQIVCGQIEKTQERLLLLIAHAGAHDALKCFECLPDGGVALPGAFGQADTLAAAVVPVRLKHDKVLCFQPLQHAGDGRVRQVEALFNVLWLDLLTLVQHKMVQDK